MLSLQIRNGKKKVYFNDFILNTVLEVSAGATRQEKEIKGIPAERTKINTIQLMEK